MFLHAVPRSGVGLCLEEKTGYYCFPTSDAVLEASWLCGAHIVPDSLAQTDLLAGEMCAAAAAEPRREPREH